MQSSQKFPHGGSWPADREDAHGRQNPGRLCFDGSRDRFRRRWPPPKADTHRAIDAVWRIESPRLIAGLARIVRDVGLAEELAQDALVAALEQWPESGVPRQSRAPGSWPPRSIARSISLRRNKLLERKHEELGRELEAAAGVRRAGSRRGARRRRRRRPAAPRVHGLPSGALDRGARRAHAAPARRPDDRGDRARVPRPGADHRPAHRPGQADARRGARPVRGARAGPSSRARLSSVLEVIYLIFNEGYSATAGDDWMRPALCEDALRLGRILAELAPQEPEVHGLVALMEIQASRSRARVGPSGEPILLLDQNRARWDHLLIRRGLAALERAEALGGARGPYALQAAIAACHARARTPAETDWARIAALYAALAQLTPSPVVELNRAVAVAMAFGPAGGPRARRCADRGAVARGLPPACRACAAICSPSSAASTRRARSSSARRRSRATRASASCCSSAPTVCANRCRPESSSS